VTLSSYDLDEFDDGTVRASGVLPANVRDALLLTHDEGARDPEGRVIWYPKGAGDAA
jgi:hypothetical protein